MLERPASTPATRIFLIDDHLIMREGLQKILEAEEDLVVCGHADNARATPAQVEKLKPDLVIVDIALPGSNGLELIKMLRARFPLLRMLALSMHDEVLYAERALRAGAKGYLMKSSSSEELVGAVRRVLQGKSYFSPALSTHLLQTMVQRRGSEANSLALLSDRELEIVGLIGKGLSTSEISNKLGISPKTVESHRGNVRTKLSLKSGAELARFSMANGLA